MKYVGWALAIIVAALTVNFAVHNFAKTPLDLWPLPFAIELPLFALVLITVFFGFCIGIVVAWGSGLRRRERAARNARDLRQASAQLDTARQQTAEAEKQLAAVSPPPPDARP